MSHLCRTATVAASPALLRHRCRCHIRCPVVRDRSQPSPVVARRRCWCLACGRVASHTHTHATQNPHSIPGYIARITLAHTRHHSTASAQQLPERSNRCGRCCLVDNAVCVSTAHAQQCTAAAPAIRRFRSASVRRGALAHKHTRAHTRTHTRKCGCGWSSALATLLRIGHYMFTTAPRRCTRTRRRRSRCAILCVRVFVCACLTRVVRVCGSSAASAASAPLVCWLSGIKLALCDTCAVFGIASRVSGVSHTRTHERECNA